MKKIYLISALLIFILIRIYLINDVYQLKIKFNFSNLSAFELYQRYGLNFSNELLNLPEIKSHVININNEEVLVYVKLKPFLLFKQKIINKIYRNLKCDKYDAIFEDDFSIKYDKLIVFISKDNYFSLFNNNQKILNDLLKFKKANKIKIYGLMEKICSIELNYDDFRKLNINLTQFLKEIKKNNIDKNYLITKNNYDLNIDFINKNLEELNKIALKYKNDEHYIDFNNLLKIAYKIKTPFSNFIKFNNDYALVYAIFKPGILFDYELLDFMKNKKINAKQLSYIKIHLKGNLNNDEIINLQKNLNQKFKQANINDVLYFYNSDIPYIFCHQELFSHNKNLLVLIYNKKYNSKIKNILKENEYQFYKNDIKKEYYFDDYLEYINEYEKLNSDDNIIEGFNMKNTLEYKKDNYLILKHKLDNNEIFNSINAINNGLFVDYFYENNLQIPIYLKINNLKNCAIYSKNLDYYVILNSISKLNFKKEINEITLKDGRFYFKCMKQ